jgi:RNase P/RNase MRP subunit POP5
MGCWNNKKISTLECELSSSKDAIIRVKRIYVLSVSGALPSAKKHTALYVFIFTLRVGVFTLIALAVGGIMRLDPMPQY